MRFSGGSVIIFFNKVCTSSPSAVSCIYDVAMLGDQAEGSTVWRSVAGLTRLEKSILWSPFLLFLPPNKEDRKCDYDDYRDECHQGGDSSI